jgi:penicillin-binding protein 1C
MKKALRLLAAGLLSLVCLHSIPSLLPYPEESFQHRADESWRLYDREGTLLREAVGETGSRAEWMPLADLSPWVAAATVAVEDWRFYRHGGIDWLSVARATRQNIQAGHVVSGASTLSMQLARLLSSQPRTLGGKLSQAWDARRIEAAIGKEQILEQYLNRAPYGAGAVGVEAASRRYFGKPSSHLSLAEAALVAGLPQAPSGHNPLRNPEAAKGRQSRVLDSMLRTGAIDGDEYSRALQEPLTYRSAASQPMAMHFTDHVLSSKPPPGSLHTTLDLDLQRMVEAMLVDHVDTLREGGLSQAAVVVLENRDCSIVAMVGSTGYWEGEDGSVNGALSLRQPGSTLKPFTYAAGFEGPYTPASVAADIPTRYLDANGLLMYPRNYSKRFRGPVLMSDALGMSLNVPAIRVANGVGLETVLQTLRRAGFTSFSEDAGHYGLGLTLGNGEVTLLELAQAYATFPRKGIGCKTKLLKGIENNDSERVFTEQVSHLVTAILSDEGIRIRGFGRQNPLLLGFPVAVKTGTSTNWRDNWAVGYTDTHTVAVWTGDFSGRPMNHLSGAIGAGPLFRKVMQQAVQRTGSPPTSSKPPEGIEEIQVCALSGMAPGEHCPHTRQVTVLSEEPRQACSWHRSLRTDRRNGLLASEKCPQEHTVERVFEHLPATYAKWQSENGQPPPTRYSPLCPAEGLAAGAMVITHPRNADVFVLEPGYSQETQSMELAVEVDPPVAEIKWLVDGELVETSEWPYGGSWRLDKGTHTVQAVAGTRRSESVAFEVR